MKWRKWLENWDMLSLRINLRFLEMEWEPREPDRDAAWQLYVELLTRITVAPLPTGVGDESAALTSVYKLFGMTRATIKYQGRDCQEFAKIAILVLNQIIRPFTTKWHRLAQDGAFECPLQCESFRAELEGLRHQLVRYEGMLAEMAGVENLTELERVSKLDRGVPQLPGRSGDKAPQP